MGCKAAHSRFAVLEWVVFGKGASAMDAAAAGIDEKIRILGDWRGAMLGKVREIIHAADAEMVEELKWHGTPVWSHGGIVCTGDVVDEAALQDLIRAAVALNLEGKNTAKPAACSPNAAR